MICDKCPKPWWKRIPCAIITCLEFGEILGKVDEELDRPMEKDEKK